MVPILVLLTFAVFLAMARVLSQERKVGAETASLAEALRAPPGPAPVKLESPYLHPAHVWVRFAPDGLATVGASDFAANFVGALSSVDAPEAGSYLRQGEQAWTLISARNRRLTQAMPLDGEVVEVNRDLTDAHADGWSPPRKLDWILKIRPSRLGENIQNLFSGTLADTWDEMARVRFSAALEPTLGRVAQDGGVWLENFGDLLDDFEWRAVRNDLFPPEQATTAR